MSLIQTQSVSLDDLVAMQPNSNFGAWAMQSAGKQQNGKIKDIDLVVNGLIQLGVVADKQSALLYLNELSKDFSKSRLVGADFDAITYSERMKRLREALNSETDAKNYLMYRMHGVLTHKFAWQLSAGLTPYHLTEEYFAEVNSFNQPTLPGFGEPNNRLFPEPAPLGNSLSSLKDTRFLADLKQVWLDVQPVLKNGANWQERCRKMRPHVRRLEKMLRPIVGSHMKELLRYRAIEEVEQSEYLAGLTLVIWASIVLKSVGSSHLLIIPELPVMHKAHRLGFRRVDGLVIVSVGGKSPNKSQRQVIQKCIDAVIRGDFKPESVSSFLMTLSKIFGAPVKAKMLDYKSAVGDFSGQEDYIIDTSICPLSSHETQVSVYMLLAGLDRYLLEGGNGHGDPWEHDDALTETTLQYLLPTSRPKNIPIIRTPSEQQKDFIQNVVRKIPHAREKGILRGLSNMFGNHLYHLLEGNEKLARRTITRNTVFKAPLLFPEPEVASPLEQVINRYRTYADSHEIVEIVTSYGKLQYRMHLDRLFVRVEAGDLETRGFSNSKGGFVTCLNPEHNDSSPSMHINLEKGFFKCYSCVGFAGVFDRQSVERVSVDSLNFQTYSAIKRRNQHLLNVVIREPLHRLFVKTQEYLQENFLRTPGAKYLYEQRSLDPEFAQQYGAGYGTTYLVEKLLTDGGFSFPELVDGGLIRFAARVSRDRSLLPLLVDGMKYSFEDVTREVKATKHSAGAKNAIPYCPLHGRVTFPLKLQGFITNFYGRATWQTDRLKHYKLSVTDGAATHGGFNLECIADHDEVIMAEGVIDALSLIAMGYKNVVGFIGITNYAILEAAMNGGKPLAFALDNDQPGRNATAKLFKWMRKAKFEQPIRNFSKTFFSDYHIKGESGYKDYNEWWKANGSQA